MSFELSSLWNLIACFTSVHVNVFTININHFFKWNNAKDIKRSSFNKRTELDDMFSNDL
jgi:hypothetical protein